MSKKIFITAIIFMIFSIISLLVIKLGDIKEINSSSTFSITYTDSFGYESIIDSTPQRIISLSPNTTEIICALGLENKLVGRTDYCDYPSSVSSITSIGSISEPNTELIANINPDIIITDGMQSKDVINSIRNLGYIVIITRNNNSLEGTYEIISDIGLVTNSTLKANQIINEMKNEIFLINNAVAKIETKKKIYYSISLSEYGLYTAGSNTYINNLLECAGLVNIATDMEGWNYSIENLLKHDPNYIICSNLYDAKQIILNYSPISNLDAVKNENIIEIDVNLIERQGPRNIDGLKLLLETIYGIKI